MVGALAALAAHAAAGGLPTLLTGWYAKYSVRPSTIYYTGDGSGTVGVLRPSGSLRGPGRGYLRWRSWAPRRAVGVGTLWLKLGSPIATSPYTRVITSVTASRPRFGRFTRMTLRYRVQGGAVLDLRCVPDRQRVYEWRTLSRGVCS